MSSKRLPDHWVQKIFVTLQGSYGTRFLNMWKTGQVLPDGNDAGVVNAMNLWAEKLGGYVDRPDVIKKVLDLLPHDPPTLPQFVELMRQAWTPPQTPALEHKWTEEELAKNKQRISKILDDFRKTMEQRHGHHGDNRQPNRGIENSVPANGRSRVAVSDQ